MMIFDRIRRLVGNGTAAQEPRIPRLIVAGDSHASAFEQAVNFKEDSVFNHVEVFRFEKVKGSISIGNISFETFLELSASLDERDYIFSAIGGNQYAVISTVEHPLGLEVLDGGEGETFATNGLMIPSRTIANYLYDALKGTLGGQLAALRKRTSANLVHLAPPPPKGDNEFISRYFEKRFGQLGMGQYGPARPELRLKMWRLQLAALDKLCVETGVTLMPPPEHCFESNGFLDPYYYAKDATHANRRYGREVLKQIVTMTGVVGLNDPSKRPRVASR